jgi:ActR/RegA family two-component response regulator
LAGWRKFADSVRAWLTAQQGQILRRATAAQRLDLLQIGQQRGVSRLNVNEVATALGVSRRTAMRYLSRRR